MVVLDILRNENLFLLVIGFIWIIGAVLQDLRRREVDNLWNFSLIAVALVYRLSASVYLSNYWFFINGIIGLFLFLILGNVLYYGRLFAGGDAKLLIALGTILPFSFNWITNFKIFGLFILFFLIFGSIYVLIWALFLIGGNWNKFALEFKKYSYNYRKFIYGSLVIAGIWVIVVILTDIVFIVISLIILLFPLLFIFAKAVEESCMVKSISVSKLTEGDWLYQDVIVGRKRIKSNWQGLSKDELQLLRKKYKRKVLIKQGIPFTPSFLFAFIGLIVVELI